MKPLDLVGPWKYTLDHFLQSFLEVAFPVIAAVIDWKVTPVSRDKELEELMPEAHRDTERFDKLFQFRLISGLDAWLLIHFEFNNHPDPDLENRLDERCRSIFKRFGVGVTHVTFLAGME